MEGCRGYSQTLERNLFLRELEILDQDIKD
jgi:hypothetical protein